MSVARAERGIGFREFAPEIACFSGGARCDIGVDFAQLRGVTAFRRSYAFSTVAALLIVLAASPVTTPFSALCFAATAHHGASVLQRTGQALRTGAHSIVFARNVDGRTAILRLIDSPVRFRGAAFDRESTFFAVLRI
jgi:hypothetical protein